MCLVLNFTIKHMFSRKRKKNINCIITTHFQMRGVLFTDAFNSRCQLVPVLWQRPGVVFAGLKAEHLNKKEEGGKPRSSEESRSGNVSCCECGTVSPAGIDRYLVLWRHPGPSSPCLQPHGTEMNISVSCEQHQSQNYCLFAREPNFLKYWTEISAWIVPKQTRFPHWIYILHLNILSFSEDLCTRVFK